MLGLPEIFFTVNIGCEATMHYIEEIILEGISDFTE
jgi:hypothetical protein